MRTTLFVLFWALVLYDLSARTPAVQPYNHTLPKCTKVEILRLDGTGLDDASGQLLLEREKPPVNIDAYYVQWGGYWTRLLGAKTVTEDAAERVAALWRALAPEAPEVAPIAAPLKPFRDGRVLERKVRFLKIRGLSKCHVPGFAYRFYSGEKLVAESTVCWMCENFAVYVDGKEIHSAFDVKAPPAVDLLALSKQLFPGVKSPSAGRPVSQSHE